MIVWAAVVRNDTPWRAAARSSVVDPPARMTSARCARRVAKGEEGDGVAEPVDVAASAHDLRQLVGAERVVAGNLALVGGRLQVALIGYTRVSTADQNRALQRDALAGAGCGTVFEDQASGSKAKRPGLAEALG